MCVFEWTPRQTYLAFLTNIYKIRSTYTHTPLLSITGYLSGLPLHTHHCLSICMLCLIPVISVSYLQSHFVFLPMKFGKWILLGCQENQLGVFSHFSPWSTYSQNAISSSCGLPAAKGLDRALWNTEATVKDEGVGYRQKPEEGGIKGDTNSSPW